MNFGYYPGCSLSGTAKEFDLSLKEVLKNLDTNLQEINDWCCCGASSAHSASHLLSVALPARNLILAKERLSVLEENSIGYKILEELKGKDLEGMEYESILDVPQQKELKKIFQAIRC